MIHRSFYTRLHSSHFLTATIFCFYFFIKYFNCPYQIIPNFHSYSNYKLLIAYTRLNECIMNKLVIKKSSKSLGTKNQTQFNTT
ncbi:hypothetical protein HanIR_Chr17g0875931 [Helianthus annuus]|nr:hypothetical protein HanIR_Chr17g0875931 [Helianthus annuus]